MLKSAVKFLSIFLTFLPDNWQALRAQWEYSHVAGAVLNSAALVAVILPVLRSSNPSQLTKQEQG